MSKAYFKFVNSKDMGFCHVESTTDTLKEDILEAFIDTFWHGRSFEEDPEEAQEENRLTIDLGYEIGCIEYRDKDDNLVLEVDFDIW